MEHPEALVIGLTFAVAACMKVHASDAQQAASEPWKARLALGIVYIIAALAFTARTFGAW